MPDSGPNAGGGVNTAPLPVDPLVATAASLRAGEDGPKIRPPTQSVGKIRAFEQKMGSASMNEGGWKRDPTCSGQGACHVRTFHAKLTADAMTYMDQQINDWLDEHPGYEVKLVTTTIGEWAGKLGVEPHLICQVWV